MSEGNVRLALIQMAYAGSRQLMLEQTLARIDDAAEQGSQIVCLQELFASPYPCQSEDHRNFDFAEQLGGFLKDQSRPAIEVGVGDGTEKTGRAAADGDEIPSHVSVALSVAPNRVLLQSDSPLLIREKSV